MPVNVSTQPRGCQPGDDHAVNETWFLLPADLAAEDLLGQFAGSQELAEQPARSLRRRHLDSFDWRLHRAGLTLTRADGAWQLRDLAGPEVACSAPAAAGRWPRFAGEFPAGSELQHRLGKLLKMRAVVHLITVVGKEHLWHVLNRDRKTVLRIGLQILQLDRPARQESWRLLRLEPLRGYDDHAAAALRIAADHDLQPLSAPPLDLLLRAADLEPEGYSSKFVADLDPAQSALSAATEIASILLRTMRQNETGLKEDVDTEFLHDFRVAVRRTRSVLTHFKGVFDAEAVGPFRDQLRQLGRATGPLRDLDVYLLDEDRYRGLLPTDLRGGLDGLFDRLRQERATELRRLRRTLGSVEYRRFTGQWAAFLADPAAGPAAAEPVGDLVRARLRKRHRRVLRDGRAITPTSPPAALHALRIECKKLRYLLEFAASLYPPGEVEALIKHLKGLQDNLGEFNDLSVQHERLRASLDAITSRGRRGREEAAAIGGLITALDARQAQVREEFATAFARFTAARVRRRFAAITRPQATRPEESA